MQQAVLLGGAKAPFVATDVHFVSALYEGDF